ncbi:acetyltransferase, GNAT family [Candidatus Vecturithrix granuli]|uniref:Acetyltransferase, GNAT family n=1 Tax=Vecturithrix granuli TaxID=1499967 RepID=A0A081C5P4_VECG1|nr:acetyltransferase, GNAT family [Candidatus Vecturithrix granuli]
MIAPTLQTQRLVIQSIKVSDAHAMFLYRSDKTVQRYQFWRPRTQGEVEDFIQKVNELAFDTEHTWYQLGIYTKQPRELIGDLGLHFLEPHNSQVEIGFTIAPTHQRQGYAAEAVISILDYVFAHMRKHRVIASVDPNNTASIALLKKLGLRQEAHFVQSLWDDGAWLDDVVYAILREEWMRIAYGEKPGK